MSHSINPFVVAAKPPVYSRLSQSPSFLFPPFHQRKEALTLARRNQIKSTAIAKAFRLGFLNLRILSTIQLSRDMDTSNPAVFVNAELLPMYVGRRVRAVIQVLRSEGGTIVGKSTDERQLIIKGSPPPSPLTTFVEVIGIADSNQSIRAEIFTNFGDNFDILVYNSVCQLANGEHKSLFI